MIYIGKESINLLNMEYNKAPTAYVRNSGMLYHYTTRDTAWKILDSDMLFATNIRFSNDASELYAGQDLAQRYLTWKKRGKRDRLPANEKRDIVDAIKHTPEEYYMLCFCDDSNLLGQWRGYALTGGVNFGFDFNHGFGNKDKGVNHCYQIFSVKNCKEDDKTNLGDKKLLFIEAPIQVKYVDKDKNKRMFLHTEFNEIFDGNEDALMHVVNYSPYIKDTLFSEEKEYRIIFDMSPIGDSEANGRRLRSKKLCFRDNEGIRQPYIKVSCSDGSAETDCVKNVYIGDNFAGFETEISLHIINKMKSSAYAVPTVCRDYLRPDIYVDEGKNQEDIVEYIEAAVEGRLKNNGRLKIWCEGHLPIREIRVGPGKDAKEMKESLEHYIDTVWWLRYVDVMTVDSPYRGK